jgi:CRISPR-associated protein Cas1
MRKLLNSLFITTEDAYLSLENENVVARKDGAVLAKVPLRSIEQILCFSYSGASPALLGKCSERGIGFSFFTPRGKYLCSILGENNRNVLLRKKQFVDSLDSYNSLSIAKSFLIGKIYNSRWVLERAKRDHALRIDVDRLNEHIAFLAESLGKISDCGSMEELRGIEGVSAKSYFEVFDDLILRDKDTFYFNDRTRRPPLDKVNALLSFIYALLSGDCRSALQGVGLDPYVGFLHVDRPGRSSLALDLVEEFRAAIADRFVLTLINTGMVNKSHFEERENGGVFLNDDGRKVVLTAWQKRKVEEITHPFLNEKIAWGLVPYVQALLLARFIRGDMDAYPPFMWK